MGLLNTCVSAYTRNSMQMQRDNLGKYFTLMCGSFSERERRGRGGGGLALINIANRREIAIIEIDINIFFLFFFLVNGAAIL